MKILGNFIDCVYEDGLYEQDMKEISRKLVQLLPDKRICMLASVLMINTKDNMYAVKIRFCSKKEDGSIDIEKIHKRINDVDFIVISKEDYCEENNIAKIMNVLEHPDSFVIFNMDIDASTLI